MTPAQHEALAILAEECGEVMQVIGKMLRHGIVVDHPTMGKWDNTRELMIEMADAVVAMTLVARELDLSVDQIECNLHTKVEALRKWTHNIDWSKYDDIF